MDDGISILVLYTNDGIVLQKTKAGLQIKRCCNAGAVLFACGAALVSGNVSVVRAFGAIG